MKTDANKQRVTKLDAARRQLRTAVALFFGSGDDVSIHTLVAAARQVLVDLLKKRGKKSRLQQHEEDLFTEEGLKIFRTAIAQAENFFKHADRDPDSEIEFSTKNTEFMLVECAEFYSVITGRMLRELWVFMLWFAFEYPDLLLPGLLLDAVKKAKEERIPVKDKRIFFEAVNVPRLWPNLD